MLFFYDNLFVYLLQVIHNYSSNAAVMADDWIVGSPCLFRGRGSYVNSLRGLVDYLLRIQCHLLVPYNGEDGLYGPVPITELQLMANSSLSSDVWSYQDCSARFVRDCSLLLHIKYVVKLMLKNSVGFCP